MRWRFILTITLIGFLIAAVVSYIAAGTACSSGACSRSAYVSAGAPYATITLLAYWVIVLAVLIGVAVWRKRRSMAASAADPEADEGARSQPVAGKRL